MFTISHFFAPCTVSLFLLLLQTCRADNSLCAPSSCGKLHNISYPFRLDTDPNNCGNHRYSLSCENNSPILYLGSGKYYVQAINYANFTIRLVDAGVVEDDCSSMPLYPLTNDNFSLNDPFSFYMFNSSGSAGSNIAESGLSTIAIFLNCPYPAENSSLYIDTAGCIVNKKKEHYTYLNIGGMDATYLMNMCSLDMTALLPYKDYNNQSYAEIHRDMAYGFQISWHNLYCGPCRGCYFDEKNIVQCLSVGPVHEVCYLEIGSPVLEFGFQVQEIRRLDAVASIGKVFLLTYCVDLSNASVAYRIFYQIERSLVAVLVLFVLLYSATKVLLGTPLVIAFLAYKWKRRHLSAYDTVEKFLESCNNLMPLRYSYFDIKRMTEDFKHKLGEGGFGAVYKGKLRSGRFAAIKMLGKAKSNGQDFMNEVATIGRVYHKNVVQLIGFCVEGSKCALVYEYMPNGSLDSYISSPKGSSLLSWEKLQEISLGVARGIEYLHQGCDMQILHFDIKPHNILLDEDFTPKISDFGLARLYATKQSIKSLTAARGTIGYMAPELFYKNIGRVSYKSDIYSFGMLLLEMAGKRKNLNTWTENSSENYFPASVYNEACDVKVRAVVEEENRIAMKMAIVGLWCIQMKPCVRPSMNEVIKMLEADLESLELPPKPFSYAEETAINNRTNQTYDSDEAIESSSLIQNIRLYYLK